MPSNHNQMFPRWTETEDAYLVKNWGRQNARQIAATLGRARSAVLGRARRIGLARSAAEDEPITLASPERPQPSLAKLRFMGEI